MMKDTRVGYFSCIWIPLTLFVCHRFSLLPRCPVLRIFYIYIVLDLFFEIFRNVLSLCTALVVMFEPSIWGRLFLSVGNFSTKYLFYHFPDSY